MSHSTRSGIALAAALLASSFVCNAPVLAHGDHGGGGGVVLPQGTTLVTMTYDVTNYRPLGDERLLALSAQGYNAHSFRQIAVASLSLAYGLTRDLTLGVRAPFLANKSIHETGEDPDAPDIVARGGVYGFGDMSFSGTYRLLHDARSGLDASIILGVKAPTGRQDAVDRDGVLFETHHQPGSGSWDGMFGATLSQEIGALTFSSNLLYTLAGSGAQDTRIGDRLIYSAALSYRLWQQGGHDHAMHLGVRPDGMMRHGGPNSGAGDGHGHGEAGHAHGHAGSAATAGLALDVSLGLNGHWSERQTVAGLKDDNTGGNVLFLTPGVRLTLDRWAGFVNVGVPIARELNGIQSEPTWQLSTGAAVQF